MVVQCIGTVIKQLQVIYRRLYKACLLVYFRHARDLICLNFNLYAFEILKYIILQTNLGTSLGSINYRVFVFYLLLETCTATLLIFCTSFWELSFLSSTVIQRKLFNLPQIIRPYLFNPQKVLALRYASTIIYIHKLYNITHYFLI